MKRLAKKTAMIIGGLCWFAFALAFGFILMQYLKQGAGLQFFGLAVSSGSLLIGLVHVVGFSTAALLCFAMGVGLCAHALVPTREVGRRGHRAPGSP